MIAQAFLAGGTTLVCAVVLHRLWLAALPRSVCPSCGGATAHVHHALSARTDRWVRRRWCVGCGWKGWGRNGPVLWRKRGPVSHGSGFRWGPDRLPPDFGFHWGRQPAPDPAPMAPAHPSGFRWGSVDEPTVTACGQPTAHPSGFRFRAAREESALTDSVHPSGFRWATESPDDVDDDGFRWSQPRPTSRDVRGSASFRWKG